MHASYAALLLAASFIAPGLAAAILPWPEGPAPHRPAPPPALPAAADEPPVMPRYDKDRALLLPERYREWVFAGSSLGLSYDASAGSHEMFNHVLIEPTAYRHFVRTGEFREGTMFVLLLHGADSGVLPGRRGQFAGEIHGVEMAVKDKTRTPEGWAYYGFGGMGGTPATSAQPASGCVNCHKQHGARDNVFLQFYPTLAQAAGVKVDAKRAAGPGPR
jgi:hypothetical protein